MKEFEKTFLEKFGKPVSVAMKKRDSITLGQLRSRI